MRIDEYESQFKSAIKEIYHFSAIKIESVLMICDRDISTQKKLKGAISNLLPSQQDKNTISWTFYNESSFSSITNLQEQVESLGADLVVIERGFQSETDELVYGLSSYVDMLTQACSSPILLLPDLNHWWPAALSFKRVLIETDHITGDNRLIDWGVSCASPQGVLVITHIENARTFSRYLEAISKIPEIDTVLAEEKISGILLKDPRHFINQVTEVISHRFPKMTVDGLVKVGSSLRDYQDVVEQQKIDLLILNTKVDGQLAMDGYAYVVAVEFKNIPLILL